MPELFDFFKENESKLIEKPSDKVWQKLESRLEKRARKRQRQIRFLQLGALALALLLLLLAAVMVWHFARKGEQKSMLESPVMLTERALEGG